MSHSASFSRLFHITVALDLLDNEMIVFQNFKSKLGFIATQMPLLDTQEDLWRLLYDRRSKTLVMLNELDADDEVSRRSRSHTTTAFSWRNIC